MEEEEATEDSWIVAIAGGYLLVLEADHATPEVTDLFPAKWVVHAVLGSAALVVLMTSDLAKGGRQGIWPDDYDMPSNIDWSLGGAEFADGVTGGRPPKGKGPGSPWSKIKKWFEKNKNGKFNGGKRKR